MADSWNFPAVRAIAGAESGTERGGSSAGWLRRVNLFGERAGHAVNSAEQGYE